MKSGQIITEATKHLDFKPINSVNNIGATTTNSNDESYQKRQKYWNRMDNILDERWEQTKKWQQDMLECLRVLRKITKTTDEFNKNNNYKNGNNSNNHKKDKEVK
jgi:hypothetical protein